MHSAQGLRSASYELNSPRLDGIASKLWDYRIIARCAGFLVITLFIGLQVASISASSGVGTKSLISAFIIPYLGLIATSSLAIAARRPIFAITVPVAHVLLGWLASNTSFSVGVIGLWSASPAAGRLLGFTLVVIPVFLFAAVSPHIEPLESATNGVVAASSVAWVLGAAALLSAARHMFQGTPLALDLDLMGTALLCGIAVAARPFLLPVAIAVSVARVPSLHYWWVRDEVSSYQLICGTSSTCR